PRLMSAIPLKFCPAPSRMAWVAGHCQTRFVCRVPWQTPSHMRPSKNGLQNASTMQAASVTCKTLGDISQRVDSTLSLVSAAIYPKAKR
ncbi:MAG: hypothetical protein VX936_05650, partial [Planctomycetota bacterium]|nr:hypothetical protein [Planctomycetota bacterium]